jgi:hypothetical protein
MSTCFVAEFLGSTLDFPLISYHGISGRKAISYHLISEIVLALRQIACGKCLLKGMGVSRALKKLFL